MTSLTEIFRIGRGPSSSHTMAPEKAAFYMLRCYPQADSFRVTLYGSLAKTGRGHRTDYAILQAFGAIPCEILWDEEREDLPHPNTMRFEAWKDGALLGEQTVLSVGGGAIEIPGVPNEASREVYAESSFDEISAVCKSRGWSLADYVFANEPEIRPHLAAVWKQMRETVAAGIAAEGELPGGLHVKRRAGSLYQLGARERDIMKKEHFLISAYAYASSEENAAGGRMVTAPTCGACGVLPAVLCYEKDFFAHRDEAMLDALATAGIIGQLIKTNGSVSGAEAGCQAEVGSACSMAAAALCSLQYMGIDQIETAAEIAMEHCLGLTCDPVGGLVQIPCIERNAVGALRAYDAATLAEAVYDNRRVSFDTVVKTMLQTGKDLAMAYRETSEGGLARCYVNKP
ncbi:MAG: L-serine ammonia-lyase [Clostridiales bacterium]|nr:L-serine ammonia-lyase [Candidatus Apopatocola equi]MCQ2439485.1 L-serine ammonia-lyase [Oscillospiraceae bacterium]